MFERLKRLGERIGNNELLCERLEQILDIAENVDGRFKTADEAEERAIEELHRFGNELLRQWAVNRDKEESPQMREDPKDIVTAER